MSDLQEQVKSAASPMEALLLIAEAVDILKVRVDAVVAAPATDPWAGWGEAPLDEGTVERVVDEKGKVEVTLPPVDEGKKDRRRAFATERLDLENAYDENYIEYYAEGGPQWLYRYDRNFCLSLPREDRVAMIEDVQEHSVSEAQEMGRDLLKDKGTGDDLETKRGHIDTIRQQL